MSLLMCNYTAAGAGSDPHCSMLAYRPAGPETLSPGGAGCVAVRRGCAMLDPAQCSVLTCPFLWQGAAAGANALLPES